MCCNMCDPQAKEQQQQSIVNEDNGKDRDLKGWNTGLLKRIDHTVNLIDVV